MGVERGDLVDLGQGETHLVGQGGEMTGAQSSIPILDQVEVLDQEVPTPRPVSEQVADLRQRGRIDLPPLREGGRVATAGARVDVGPDAPIRLVHDEFSLRKVGRLHAPESTIIKDAPPPGR